MRKFLSRSIDRNVSPRAAIEPLESRIVLSALPTGFTESVVASNLTSPTAMEFSPDGKLFIAEQRGTMQVWQNSSLLRSNFFQNTPISTQTFSERGLLGVAFHPDYAVNRFVYVYYTTTAGDGHNRVSRFTANSTGDLALAGSENIIMELDPHSAGNHNGGAMHFGPDGLLYIAAGDNAQGANAQSLANRHGKMLRIDVNSDDFPADPNQDWHVPAGQPTTFAGVGGTTSGLNRSIWAIGLRNPFTFAFQPGTGRVFINDVGQGTWEEINEGGAGRNFGWPSTEGDFTQANFPSFTRPFYTYDHGGAEPNGIAITGGAFYNPSTNQFPSAYVGDYFFADYGSNKIWNIDLSTKVVNEFASNAQSPVDLKVDSAGNLYYLARSGDLAFRVSYTSQPPSITDQPDSQTISVGSPVTFSVTASGAGPFTYQWQRAENGTSNFLNISGATGRTYTINSVQSSDNGDKFRVIVKDTINQTTTSAIATLTATTNRAPVATLNITGGLRNGKWDAGKPINFAGSTTDADQGPLPSSRYSWRVDYLTSINAGDTDSDGLPGVTRPFVAPFSNTTASNFTPATTGPYTLTDVAYVVTLVVTDNGGLTDTERVVIYPNTVTLNLATNPTGLQVTVDGQPSTAPKSFGSVVGFLRPIGTSTNQSLNGTNYNFANWSDGGAATHTIATPTVNTTYTANFNAGGFAAKVNFQTTNSQGFAGYVADTGLVFGSRGNGFSYGWNVDNTSLARNRNSSNSSDERYDTLNHLQGPTGNKKWEIALPNGTYTIKLVAGDPSYTDSRNNFNLEGIQLTDPDGFDNFDEFNTTVTVTDGRLTITPGANASNAKLAFIDITANATSADTKRPTVNAKLPAPGATMTSSTVNINIAFSEPVKGLDVTDLVLTGTGAVGAIKSAPVHLGNNLWRFAVSNLKTGVVNVSLAPDANDIEDLAGNDLLNVVWSFNVNLSSLQSSSAVKSSTTFSQLRIDSVQDLFADQDDKELLA